MKIEKANVLSMKDEALHQSTVAKDSVHGITQLATGAEDVASFANAESTREDRDNPFMETTL